MENKYARKIGWFFIFLNMIFLVCCADNKSGKDFISSVEPTPTFLVKAPTQTEQLLPTFTVVPTDMSTLTPFPMATETKIPIPTLSDIEGYQEIVQRLRTNGGCTLPCFLGIKPEQTTWSEAKDLFAMLGKRALEPFQHTNYTVGSYSYEFSQEEQSMLFGVGIYVQNDKITMIDSEIHQVDDPQIEKQYSIKTVLSTLGVPTDVLFTLSGFGALGPEDINAYQIKLYYHNANQWLFLQYEGMAIKKKESVSFCPNNLLQGIKTDRVTKTVHLIIQPTPNPYTLNDVGILVNKGIVSGMDLEHATGVTPQVFYDSVIGSEENVCFLTPVKLW